MTAKEIAQLPDDKLSAMVAELLGWELLNEGKPSSIGVVMGRQIGTDWRILPRYVDDLDAMHEAEKTLTERQREVYADVLSGQNWYNDIPGDDDYIGWIEMPAEDAFNFVHATARQRAEVFALLMQQ